MRMVKLTEESRSRLLEDLLKRSPNQYPQYESRVSEIIANIREKGDEALFSYTKAFDKADIGPENVRVTEEEIQEAYTKVDPGLVDVIRKALVNIRSYHEKQKRYSWFDSTPKRHPSWTESHSSAGSRCVCTWWKGCVSLFRFDEHCSCKSGRCGENCHDYSL